MTHKEKQLQLPQQPHAGNAASQPVRASSATTAELRYPWWDALSAGHKTPQGPVSAEIAETNYSAGVA